MLKKLHISTLSLVVLFVAVISGKILFEIDPLQPLEYKVYDYLLGLRQRKAAAQVVILAIDQKSVQSIGSWPWPRSYIANAVRQLTRDGTHTMGLSLLYSSREVNPGLEEIQLIQQSLPPKPSKSQAKSLKEIAGKLSEALKRLDHDQQLISAVRSARRVVLPLRFSLENASGKDPPPLSAWLALNSLDPKSYADDQSGWNYDDSRYRGILKTRTITATGLIRPYEELSKKAGALGHTNVIAESDGVVRKMPLLINYQARDFLAFALQVARKHAGLRLRDIKTGSAGLELRRKSIPTEKDHSLFIDFSGQSTNIRQISFLDVMDGKILPESFQGKVVLIGVTAEGISPRYKTPLNPSASGVEIDANVVENIVNGKFISRPSWVFALEILALLYFGFFLLFVIPRVAPRIGILIMGIFLTTWLGAGAALFVASGIWLKILTPAVLSIVGLILAGGDRRMAEKQDENVQLNMSLGLALQGQGMLDMAFEKLLKCPIEDRAVQKLLYNLGLDFERKRMFNKALAVYRQILQGGKYKDVKERIKKLAALENTLVMSAGSPKRETTFLVQNGTTRPTLGRYEIVKELGQGAMGTVYLGRDPSIQRLVAVKTLSYAEIAGDELADVKARFFREAEAAGKLSHPNIVTIYDVGEDHDMAYIAMELLEGRDLTHCCQKDQLLPLKRVLNIISLVAEALGYAHDRQVVHRDIKPANIMLMKNDQIRVADFGIARVISSSKTHTGVIFGTPSYMSPEQVAGKKVDGRSDLFSLGVVFYEMLTGQRPFSGDSISALLYAVSNSEYVPLEEIAPKTPPGCARIIERMLAKGVSKRYQTASQVIKDIRQCQDALS
ncbi:MAG: serine/threonine-protein kinase [Desulfobacteraceae bacterium]|jgi:serine/threonine-protein kinase|nr:serine/threonine-protein kinase [Desulfobacteraceae bacterium]